jgi:magnesium-transporting ATPase (P-type)
MFKTNIKLSQDFLNNLNKLNQDLYVDLDKLSKIIILLILISYISIILLKYNSLSLPEYIINLFENPLIRFLIIIFILLISFIDIQLTIIITIAFLLTVHIINKQKINKMIQNKNNIN